MNQTADETQGDLHYREIVEADIPELFAIRVCTHENRMSLDELRRLGIDDDWVRQRINTTGKGWICVDQNLRLAQPTGAGFVMGDRESGELLVIALRPEYVGRGIGSRLIRLQEDWLFGQGCERLWLTTDLDKSLKAYNFYLRHGWQDWKIEDDLRYMQKFRPRPPASGARA